MGDADGPEVRHALLRTLGLRAYETHTGGGACGWLAVGGTMRALTPEEIRHDLLDASEVQTKPEFLSSSPFGP